VGNSGAVKLRKIAAAKAAVESIATKTGRDGRGAGVEAGQRMNARCTKLTKPRTTAKIWSPAAEAGGRRTNAWALG
jgi:hypothetical protein